MFRFLIYFSQYSNKPEKLTFPRTLGEFTAGQNFDYGMGMGMAMGMGDGPNKAGSSRAGVGSGWGDGLNGGAGAGDSAGGSAGGGGIGGKTFSVGANGEVRTNNASSGKPNGSGSDGAARSPGSNPFDTSRPYDVRCTSVASTSVDLHWSAPEGHTAFELEWREKVGACVYARGRGGGRGRGKGRGRISPMFFTKPSTLESFHQQRNGSF